MAALRGRSIEARLLVCRVGTKLCGLPLQHVLETFRPLATEPLAGANELVLGVALIRGVPTPVVDARQLLSSLTAGAPGRYVTLALGEGGAEARVVALAVDSVLGIRDGERLGPLPALLREHGEVVAALGTLDAELLLVLERARLVPDAVWPLLEPAPGSA
jgi:purine-binding chemotaxis protein CheW